MAPRVPPQSPESGKSDWAGSASGRGGACVDGAGPELGTRLSRGMRLRDGAGPSLRWDWARTGVELSLG